ncbi:SAM-dependent methyltransferase [Candidatus Pelagibacter sp. RS39]|uniref:SAM-dependent methyltransferase n=1 Tax=Candidatus Pelagibacter sp. RS39 TaxID=1977864 RepID=UPI000A14AEF2|nr:SAM-dependent methyltransferase [Candidatus Pelagibacter sp. RS39]ARJ48260.1 cyclopropane-fatty-acyl-phospholipid synthase [Candidatus Pelagibacter sp. RS39]
MIIKNNFEISLDKFINFALYDKKKGYYMQKSPFGRKGDFITAPNISRMFSEMIAIWILGFWENLGNPKKINLVELGAGNGEMMKILLETFKKFPMFFDSCNFLIHEKSLKLKKIQKDKLDKDKIIWITDLKEIKKFPTIFIANEFFDAMAIKQFIKKRDIWFERYVIFKNKKKAFFNEKSFNMSKFEKEIGYNISKNQKFIEYSLVGVSYLKKITDMIKKNNGGLLIIDYGYMEKKMKNTLKSISNHKHSNVLENIGKSDITHNINFYLFKKIIDQLGGLKDLITTQGSFLVKLGIKNRAEIISQNQNFSKKADIYYRLKRLIDDKEMGNLFKVMFIKKKNNKYKLGFN